MVSYEFEAKTIIQEGRTSQSSIDAIKTWLPTASLPDLPEELIVLFLLSCRNHIYITQNTIRAHYRIKKEAPEIFNNRNILNEELQNSIKTASFISIPERMANNTVIHFFKLNDTSFRRFHLIPSMKLAYMLLDISQRHNPPNDLVVIMDMQGLNIMHLTRLKIGAVKVFLEFLQEAMPVRIQMIHVLNTTYLFDKILAIARVFIKNDLMSILKAHPPEMDMQQFFKDWVPASCLPQEYGGSLPSTEELNQQTIKLLQELTPFFEAEERLRSSIVNE